MTTLLASLALLAGLAAAPSVAAAPAWRYVALSPPASGGHSCAAPDYKTIDAAVTAAVTGDTLYICAGTYTSTYVGVGASITIMGDPGGTTIIDGGNAHRIFDATGRFITLSSLTLRNGSVLGAGGAISSAIVIVANSTFSWNTASGGFVSGGNGGAIAGTAVTATNDTFAGNTASRLGGAIYVASAIALTNDVFAQASATNNCGLASLVPLNDLGGNWSTDASCVQSVSHVTSLASLALGALASNGGPTQTIALGAGSAAIDAACAAWPVSGLDQRGISRPQGAHCDAGAYEASASLAGATYVTLAPARILDTRGNLGLAGKFTSTVPRSLQVTGAGGVPADAIAVTAQTAAGIVALTTVSTPPPTTATMNFPTGDTRANGATAPLGSGGVLWITYIGVAGGATADILFDVTGCFRNQGEDREGPGEGERDQARAGREQPQGWPISSRRPAFAPRTMGHAPRATAPGARSRRPRLRGRPRARTWLVPA